MVNGADTKPTVCIEKLIAMDIKKIGTQLSLLTNCVNHSKINTEKGKISRNSSHTVAGNQKVLSSSTRGCDELRCIIITMVKKLVRIKIVDRKLIEELTQDLKPALISLSKK